MPRMSKVEISGTRLRLGQLSIADWILYGQLQLLYSYHDYSKEV